MKNFLLNIFIVWPIEIIFGGVTLYCYWNWFVAYQIGAEEINIFTGIGFFLVLCLLSVIINNNRKAQEIDEKVEVLLKVEFLKEARRQAEENGEEFDPSQGECEDDEGVPFDWNLLLARILMFGAFLAVGWLFHQGINYFS